MAEKEKENFEALSLDDIRKAIAGVEDELADLETELHVTFSMDARHIPPAEAGAELEAIRRDRDRLLERKKRLLAALSSKLGGSGKKA